VPAFIDVYADSMSANPGEIVNHVYLELYDGQERLIPGCFGLDAVFGAHAMVDGTRYDVDCTNQENLHLVGAPSGPLEVHITAHGRPIRTARELNTDVHPDEVA
jgi:hypothetical protein